MAAISKEGKTGYSSSPRELGHCQEFGVIAPMAEERSRGKGSSINHLPDGAIGPSPQAHPGRVRSTDRTEGWVFAIQWGRAEDNLRGSDRLFVGRVRELCLVRPAKGDPRARLDARNMHIEHNDRGVVSSGDCPWWATLSLYCDLNHAILHH